MASCTRCRHGEGSHDPACPTREAGSEVEYSLGWEVGRAGEACPEGVHPSFRLGWVNGTVALEEAENGSPW
jgi:hypothetical protein